MLELYFEKRAGVTRMKPGAMERSGIRVEGPVLQGKLSVQDALLKGKQEAEWRTARERDQEEAARGYFGGRPGLPGSVRTIL